jgi:hypothetical protein
MQDQSYLGVHTRYSVKGKYRADITKTEVRNGKSYFAATISEKIRSYWQPLLSGINITEAEIQSYFTKDM